MKEALLRFTVFSSLGQFHFQWVCYGHFYNSIKIIIFKTLTLRFHQPHRLRLESATAQYSQQLTSRG